jgi:hypothetical protein
MFPFYGSRQDAQSGITLTKSKFNAEFGNGHGMAESAARSRHLNNIPEPSTTQKSV